MQTRAAVSTASLCVAVDGTSGREECSWWVLGCGRDASRGGGGLQYFVSLVGDATDYARSRGLWRGGKVEQPTLHTTSGYHSPLLLPRAQRFPGTYRIAPRVVYCTVHPTSLHLPEQKSLHSNPRQSHPTDLAHHPSLLILPSTFHATSAPGPQTQTQYQLPSFPPSFASDSRARPRPATLREPNFAYSF